jgi:lipoprotein-releasing system permease protein
MIELRLAFKYLLPKRSAVSVITLISLMGVMLGVAVLIVVNSVMNGFTNKMQNVLLSTISHIQISNPYSSYIRDSQKVVDNIDTIAGLKALPLIRRECVIQSMDKVSYKYLIGLPKNMEGLPLDITKKIVSSAKGVEVWGHNKIVISKIVANELGVKLGDKIFLHSPNKLRSLVDAKREGKYSINKAEKYSPTEFIVSAFYSFDKYDFDKNIIFAYKGDVAELYAYPKGAATSVYVWTPNPFMVETYLHKLKLKYPYLNIFSWKQLEQQVMEMLSLQKIILIFLLTFIVLVSSVCILCTMITIVAQKRCEIGIMKALGASNGMLIKIFALQGGIIGGVGTLLGVLLGLIILFFRNDIVSIASSLAGRNLWNPEFYFFTKLPAIISPTETAFICIVAICLSVVGALLPAMVGARIEPAKAMRSE